MNPLIRLWFDTSPHNTVSSFAPQHENPGFYRQKISLANFSIPISLSPRGRNASGLARRAKMAWKTPKIVEVPVGMEINMYACAARK
jgi:coenzyme PQQ precursor peptide PqqA